MKNGSLRPAEISNLKAIIGNLSSNIPKSRTSSLEDEFTAQE